jgi:pimeloyl-ACP methyl ester carboxylesterase
MPHSVNIDGLTLDVAMPARVSQPPMLVVHGIMGGAWYFAKWLQFFSARGHPAYALNLRGHHGSRPVENFGQVSVMDYVADVRDAASGIHERHAGAPFILAGHSMGGLVVQKAAESLSPAALILLSSVPPQGIPLLSWPLFRRELKHVPQMLASKAVIASPRDAADLFLNRVDPTEVASFVPLWTPASGRAGREITFGRIAVDAKRVTCPVLVVGGTDDVAIPPRIQRKVARKYGAPFRVYEGNAHFLIWEAGWNSIASDVGTWLDHTLSKPAARSA